MLPVSAVPSVVWPLSWPVALREFVLKAAEGHLRNSTGVSVVRRTVPVIARELTSVQGPSAVPEVERWRVIRIVRFSAAVDSRWEVR